MISLATELQNYVTGRWSTSINLGDRSVLLASDFIKNRGLVFIYLNKFLIVKLCVTALIRCLR